MCRPRKGFEAVHPLALVGHFELDGGVADPQAGRPTRVRFDEKTATTVRVAVKSGETIDG